MTTSHTEKNLREALTHFETALLTPIVSGEQTAWLDDAQQLLAQVCDPICESSVRQKELLTESLRRDPNISARVEEWRDNEARLFAQLDALKSKLGSLHKKSTEVQPDELKLENPIKEMIERGLDLVVLARKLDTSSETWHAEVFHQGEKVSNTSSNTFASKSDNEFKDIVQEASEESFPASDPPSRSPITST